MTTEREEEECGDENHGEYGDREEEEEEEEDEEEENIRKEYDK